MKVKEKSNKMELGRHGEQEPVHNLISSYLPDGQGWNGSQEYPIGLFLLMAHFYTPCPLFSLIQHISFQNEVD